MSCLEYKTFHNNAFQLVSKHISDIMTVILIEKCNVFNIHLGFVVPFYHYNIMSIHSISHPLAKGRTLCIMMSCS